MILPFSLFDWECYCIMVTDLWKPFKLSIQFMASCFLPKSPYTGLCCHLSVTKTDNIAKVVNLSGETHLIDIFFNDEVRVLYFNTIQFHEVIYKLRYYIIVGYTRDIIV